MKKIILSVCTASLLLSACALSIGGKTLKLSFEDSMQSYDENILKSTVWEVKGMASDKQQTRYYIYTSNSNVIYIHPYKKLVYSRSGDVIGFVDKEKIIRLHAPYDGWGDIDRTNVGTISNPYEGKHLPDFSTYGTPPYKDGK